MARQTGSKNKQTQERMNTVEGMLLGHYSDHQVIQASMRQWGCAESTVRKYIRNVRQRWVDEAEARRPSAKAAAINRLHRIGRKSSEFPHILIQVERMLSDIEGTRDPVKVDQNLTVDIDAASKSALDKLTSALGAEGEE